MSVRSAVGITNNNSGQLGQQVSLELASPVNVSAGSPQAGSVCQITLDAGVWVLDGSVLATITNPADFSAGTSFFYFPYRKPQVIALLHKQVEQHQRQEKHLMAHQTL